VNKEDSRLSWTDVSAAILSTAPVVAERSMYLNARGKLFGAGHASAGITQASTSWFLAEGATGDFFDLFVLIANPTASSADVRVTYLLQGGGTIQRTYRVAGRSRYTIWVDQEDARLANASLSTLVQSTNDLPIIVERAMWWPGRRRARVRSERLGGATRAATRWAVADGRPAATPARRPTSSSRTRNRARERRSSRSSGRRGAVTRTIVLPPSSRMTVAVGPDVPELRGTRFGTLVQSIGRRRSRSSSSGDVFERGQPAVGGGHERGRRDSCRTTSRLPGRLPARSERQRPCVRAPR